MMNLNLKNKVAIVAGGARDIGRAISENLALNGAKVVVNYFDNKADADETLSNIQKSGGEAIIVQGDMTIEADIQNLVKEGLKAFGNEIGVLVNVVGGLVERRTIDKIDGDFWDYLINLNAKSACLLTKHIVPYMTSGGSIINFSSQAAKDGGGPGASIYATSKGAVTTFTRAMAKELGNKNIRVNAICPGMINTTFHDTFTKDEVREKVASITPLGREGRAAEVADLVTYLASERASFITGNNIDINGGLLFS